MNHALLSLIYPCIVGVMSISSDVYKSLNASKHAAKVPPEAGGGYMAIFEGIHLIHCVVGLPSPLVFSIDSYKEIALGDNLPLLLHRPARNVYREALRVACAYGPLRRHITTEAHVRG